MKKLGKILSLLYCEASAFYFRDKILGKETNSIVIESLYEPTWRKLVGKNYSQLLKDFLKQQKLFLHDDNKIIIDLKDYVKLTSCLYEGRAKPFQFKQTSKILQKQFPEVEEVTDLNDPTHNIWKVKASISMLHTYPAIFDPYEYTPLVYEIQHILERMTGDDGSMICYFKFPERYAEAVTDLYDYFFSAIYYIFANSTDLVEGLELSKDKLRTADMDYDRVIAFQFFDELNKYLLKSRRLIPSE